MKLDWLQKQLGSADTKKTVGEKNQYEWRCDANGYLIADADKSGNVLALKGEYNSESGSGLFDVQVPQTRSAREFDKMINQLKGNPAPVPVSATQENNQQEQITSEMHAARLRNYNNIYKTTFTNQNELDIDMTLKIKNYYAGIRQCRQGTYDYVMPVQEDFLYYTAAIHPQKDGRCVVNTSYTIPQIGKMDVKCNYQPESLQLFTDTEATTALTNKAPFDNDHPSDIQKAMKQECKRYVDGVL